VFFAVVGACFVVGGGGAWSGSASALETKPSGRALALGAVLATQFVVETYREWQDVVYLPREQAYGATFRARSSAAS